MTGKAWNGRSLNVVAVLLLALASRLAAQELKRLNPQVHGYVTQGLVYSTHNNFFAMDTSSGSPAWNEAVLTLTVEPAAKLRLGAQAHSMYMGGFGETLSLDWASADLSVNDHLGFRVGKVKTPIGLMNEEQDIDPSYLWSLLPQGVYDILSRNTFLAHLGGLAYGAFNVPHTPGRVEWDVFGGEQVEAASDPNILLGQQATGNMLPDGWSGPMWGLAVRIHPLPELTVGASDTLFQTTWLARATHGSVQGVNGTPPSQNYYLFARYEKKRGMVAGEYFRQPYVSWYNFPDAAALNSTQRVDQRSWYLMASYRLSRKLNVGAYDSQSFDRQMALGPGRYNKDWTLSARYDFNQFLYAKAEGHFVQGTFLDYDQSMNRNGLQPGSRMMIFKVGVSF